MFTLLVGKNEFKGELQSIEFEGEDLVLKFVISPSTDATINVTLPKFPEELKILIKNMGFNNFKNSTLNLNTGSIEKPKTIM